MSGIIDVFTLEYKEQANEYVDILFALAKKKDSTPAERIERVEVLTESYFDRVGMHADGPVLERLASLILYDEITDPDVHKVSHNEAPILSERQQFRRQRSEVNDAWLEYQGIDGKDYRIKTRDSNRNFRERTEF